jgi:hypothetical protein
VDYLFVDKAQFEEWIQKDELLEHAMVYGEYKGIPRSQASLERVAVTQAHAAARMSAALAEDAEPSWQKQMHHCDPRQPMCYCCAGHSGAQFWEGCNIASRRPRSSYGPANAARRCLCIPGEVAARQVLLERLSRLVLNKPAPRCRRSLRVKLLWSPACWPERQSRW